MFVTNFFDVSNIESSLGVEKSKPIVYALQKAKKIFIEQQTIIDKHQSILNDQSVAIQNNKDSFEEYKKDDLNRKAEIKQDLLIEIATKADIERLTGKIDAQVQQLTGKIDAQVQQLNGKIDAQGQQLNGKIDAQGQQLNGKIDALEQKMNGEFKRIHLWMRMLLILSLLSIACFSPTAQALIKLLKF